MTGSSSSQLQFPLRSGATSYESCVKSLLGTTAPLLAPISLQCFSSPNMRFLEKWEFLKSHHLDLITKGKDTSVSFDSLYF